MKCPWIARAMFVKIKWYMNTDRNNLEDSYYLVKHFSDLTFWEYLKKVKSEKCFTNQQESSKFCLSV